MRLSCDRSFVSLIDRKHRYIIAEATRSLAYFEGPENSRDSVYLGVVALDIAQRELPNAIHAFTDTTGQADICTPNVQAGRSKFRIRSLQDDEDYSDRPYVHGWPYVRTYLEVPLRAATGQVIGSFCAVDNRLRGDWDEDDAAVRTMHDIARVIMDHLDLVKMKDQHKRVERLVDNLCVYVEENTMRNSAEDGATTDDSPAEELSEESSGSSPEPGPMGARSAIFSPSDGSLATELTTPSPGPRPDPFESASSPRPEDLHFRESMLNPRPEGLLAIERASHLKPGMRLKAAISVSSASGRLHPKSRPSNVPDTFSRAARLIQEATDVEGIMFLDASPNGFATRLNPDIGGPGSNRSSASSSPSRVSNSTKVCKTLGIAINGEPTTTGKTFAVPEPLLQRLLQAYPKGAIFFTGDLEELDGNSADVQRLFEIFTPARFILFMPLWDYFKEAWYAATIGWSSSPRPLFASEDLIYISAFGNSIMAEISRLEAVTISYAKSNFISSISHELRSPLHGILASVELLEQTALDTDRLRLFEMIEMCGTTLLETMEHLLDFAEINHFTGMGRQTSSDSLTSNRERNRDKKGYLSLSRTVDLSVLVQEVVEGAYLGHFAQTNSELEKTGILEDTSGAGEGCMPDRNPVVFTMDIKCCSDWLMHIEPGAWRRIVLNLVGNALKYTERGSIEVALELVDGPSGSDSPPAGNSDHGIRYVRFSIKDTGRGIGVNYLKHRIFTPYAQENPLVNGTGLGLSIVNRLVTYLGGTIDIRSEVGVGTQVQVTVPVPMSAGSPTLKPAEPAQPRGGKRIVAMTARESLEPANDDESLLSSAIHTAQHWLGMEVIPQSTVDDENTVDLCLLQASHLEAAHKNGDLKDVNAAVLVLCTRPPTRPQNQAAASCNATFLQQPFGPKKLKASLEAARARFCRHRVHHPSSLHDPPATPNPPFSTELPLHEGASANGTLAPPTRLQSLPSPLRTQTPPPSPAPPTPKIRNVPPHSSSPPTTETPALEDRPMHVLLVDDNAINLRILSTYVRTLGCTFATATNGYEALEAFKEATARAGGGFDVVLMDVSMPVMNGFEATRAIRALERQKRGKAGGGGAPTSPLARRGKACRILALTGLGSAESQREAFSSGMDEFLMKPVPLKRIKEVLFSKIGH